MGSMFSTLKLLNISQRRLAGRMGVWGATWGGVSRAAEVLSSQVVGSTSKACLLVGRASVSAGRSWNWIQLHPWKPVPISRESSGSTSLILWYPRLGLDKQHVRVLIRPWQMFLCNGECRWLGGVDLLESFGDTISAAERNRVSVQHWYLSVGESYSCPPFLLLLTCQSLVSANFVFKHITVWAMQTACFPY